MDLRQCKSKRPANQRLIFFLADCPMQGYVTAAQKINRKNILSKYQKEVDQAYSGGS